MRISIITVTYNRAHVIRGAIEGVLSQNYKDYEYIIVDGASKDNTIDILNEYEPKFEGRMRWISEPDKGLMMPSTRVSRLFFLGSITRYHPYFFESILNAKEQRLISEFLNTQPMQFMYNVTSKVVGKYIFKSRADSL